MEQSDGTSWMAMYCLDLLEISLTLARHDRTYEDLATKFFEHSALIAEAMHTRGLWDEEDGFYYDVLATGSGQRIPLKVRSMVGLLPLAATTTLGRETLDELSEFTARTDWFIENRPDYDDLFHMHERDGSEGRLLAIVSPDRLRRPRRWGIPPDRLDGSGRRSEHPPSLNCGCPLLLRAPQLRAKVSAALLSNS